MKLKFEEFEKHLLRFIYRGQRYHGTVTIKFYNGKISNIQVTDSLDTEQLRNTTLNIEDTEMLIKTGSPVKGDLKSSKIVTQVKIEENNVKEQTIEKNENTKKQQ